MENEVIIDGVNVAEERKFLIHTDTYSIGEDGLINSTIPLTDVCYALALQLQRAKEENEHIKEAYNSISDSFMKLRNEEWNCYYLASTIKSIFEGARGATEQALKQTTLENVMYYVRIADRYLHFQEDTIKREIKEKNNKYKQALKEIRESCNTYAKTEDYVIDQTFNEFLENVFNKTNEVLNEYY